MIDELGPGNARFFAHEIESDELVAMGEERVELGIDDPLGLEPMRVGHETGAEPELDVVEPFTTRVFDVLVGDAPARILVRENACHELNPSEKANEIGFRLHDLQMRPK